MDQRVVFLGKTSGIMTSKFRLPQRPEKKDSVKKWYEMIYVVASLGGTMLTLHHYMLCLQSTLTKLWRISSDFSTTITSCSVVKTLVAIHSECLPKKHSSLQNRQLKSFSFPSRWFHGSFDCFRGPKVGIKHTAVDQTKVRWYISCSCAR